MYFQALYCIVLRLQYTTQLICRFRNRQKDAICAVPKNPDDSALQETTHFVGNFWERVAQDHVE